MKKITASIQYLVIAFIAAVILGAAAAVFQPKPFLTAWLATNLLLWLSFYLGMLAWRKLGGGKTLAAMMLVAFFLRVVLGLFLHTALPVLGFENDVQDSGFVYSDAFNRDNQAFALASSGNSLLSAFSRSQQADQYGGLLYLSASVYRILSPDVSRPVLVTLLAALFMSVGLAFLYRTVLQRWGQTAALVAGWFYALYPEGVLLGSSQMREPFLIGLFCIAFWAVVNWRQHFWQKVVIFVLAMSAAGLFSIPFGGALSGLLILYFLVDWLSEQKTARNKTIGWTALILFASGFVAVGWMWLKPTMYYDAYLTERSSGYIQALIRQLGGKEWMIPFTSLSGVTQPLLPAALFYPSKPIWMSIMSYRALGWYFAIPFIVYAFFAAWKSEPQHKHWAMILIAVSMAAWVCIASMRAGGDQWDNPRYRALLIPWLALLVGWGWQRIRSGKGAWFYRWLAVEAVFLLGLFNWYLNKFHYLKTYLPFFVMVGLILGLSALIIITGVVMDLHAAKKNAES